MADWDASPPRHDQQVLRSVGTAVAPRVGGGYATMQEIGSHAYVYGSGGMLRADGVDQLQEARCEQASSFDAHEATAVAVVQGGAAVWTAEGDGTLAVRNPETGEVRHTIARPDGDTNLVTTLHPHGNHVWVGTENGTVEVYEHLLAALLIATPDQHKGSVTCFSPSSQTVELPDGTMSLQPCTYSLSSGTLNKWGSESETFALLCTFDLSKSKAVATSLASDPIGRVYIGAANGSITLCTPELQVLGSWKAHVGASVSSLLHTCGALFSGGSDGQLKVWEASGGEGGLLLAQEDVEGTVRKVVKEGDGGCELDLGSYGAVGYSVAADGGVLLLTTDPEGWKRWRWNGAQLERIGSGGEEVLDLSSHTAWRGMRALSYGSSGKNTTWFSARSTAADEMERTAAHMRAIIHEDSQEIRKWTDLINTVKDRDLHRKTAAALFYRTRHTETTNLLAVYYTKLFLFMRTRKQARRARRIRRTLEERSSVGVLSRYFAKWKAWAAASKKAKEDRRAAEFVLCHTERGLLRVYWNKLWLFFSVKTRSKRKDQLVELLRRNTETGTMFCAYRRLLALKKQRAEDKKSEAYAAKLSISNNRQFLLFYYYKLLRHRVNAKDVRHQLLRIIVMQKSNDRRLASRYFAKLHTHALERKMRRVYGDRLSILLGSDRVGGERWRLMLLRRSYLLWRGYVSVRKQKADGAALEELTGKKEALIEEQEHSPYAKLVKRERELSDKVDAVRDRKNELKARVAALNKTIDELKGEAAAQGSMLSVIYLTTHTHTHTHTHTLSQNSTTRLRSSSLTLWRVSRSLR